MATTFLRTRSGFVVAIITALLAVLTPATGLAQEGDPPTHTLVFTQQPAGASGGTAFETQPVVELQDEVGGTVAASGTVALSIAPSTGTAGAVLTCAPVDMVAGVATFAGCSIDKVGSGFVLRAEAVGVDSSDSAPFDVAPGAPVALAFAVQPTSITAGAAFAPAVAVELRDAGNNPVNSANHALGLIAVDETGGPVPLTGCSGGNEIVDEGATFYSVATPEGQSRATFASCSVDRSGSDFTMLAVAVGADASAPTLLTYSTTFDVTAGTPTQIAFVSQPGGATTGQPLSRQPIIELQDTAGNRVTDHGYLTANLYAPDDGIHLTCPGATPGGSLNLQVFVDGVATYTDCQLASAGGNPFGGTQPLPPGDFVLRAAVQDDLTIPSVDSQPSGADADEAASLVFLTQPGHGTAGMDLSEQPVLAAHTATGATTPATISIELEDQSPTGPAIECSRNEALTIAGAASFFGCSVDTPGTYRLNATSGDLSVLSDPFDISVGDPVAIAITDAPTATVVGDPFAIAAELLDAGGNTTTRSGDDVRVALVPGDGGQTADMTCLGGIDAPTAGGTVEFTECNVDRPGTYRVVASSPVGVALSDPFVVMTGAPASVTFVSTPVGSIDGGLLATPVVLVEDAGGNALDAPVALVATDAALQDCDLTVTSSHGLAAFPACVVDATGSSLILTATADDVSASVTVPVSHGAPVGSSPVGVPLEQTFGGNVHATNPTFVTNEVNGTTGALQFTIADLTVAGIGVPLQISRTYNSWDTDAGLFGPGWSSIFDAGVDVAADGAATVRAEDGQRISFPAPTKCKNKKMGCSGAVTPTGSLVDLACKQSTCTVTRHDGVSYTSVNGRITRYLDRTGHGLTFRYNRSGDLTAVELQTSGADRTVTITVEDGRITSVDSPTRSLGYAYDLTGRLVAVTDAAGHVTGYSYDADDRLVERTIGEEQLRVSYGADGRVATAELDGRSRRFKDRYQVATDAATGISTTTRLSSVTAHGTQTEAAYAEHHRGNVMLWEQSPEGETQAYSFDTRGNWTAFQDGVGRVQRMFYDSANNLTRLVAPDGGTTRYAYDGDHRIVQAVDPLGNTFESVYANDVLLWTTPPDLASNSQLPGSRGEVGTKFEHDDLGQLVGVVTPESYRRITHDEFGNETGHQVFDPDDVDLIAPINGNGPVLEHDEAGNVTGVTSARGHLDDGSLDPAYRTTYQFDGNDQMVEHRTPQGDVTSYAFTPDGEIAATTRPVTGTTTYTWDEATGTKTATGATTGTWTFDAAGRLVASTDESARTTTWTFDRSGRTVAETGPTGFTTRQVHDANNNIVRVIDRQGTLWVDHGYHGIVREDADGVVETTTFDVAGNVVEHTDAEGQTSNYAYDAHGNLSSVATAVGVTSYTYDGVGGLVSMTDGNGNVTTYANDAAGQLVSTTLAGSTWLTEHDVDGNVTATTDPDGRITDYTLDPEGRQVGILHTQLGQPDIEITQTFDGQGRRTAMSDPTGLHGYAYDDDGRMTSATSPLGTFVYDHSVPGQRTDTHPDETQVVYHYNDGGQVMSLSADDVSVAYMRSGSGRITGIANGNALLETRGHDQDGRLVTQDLSCGSVEVLSTRYGYDADSRPLGVDRIVGQQSSSQRFGYDDHGRIGAEDRATIGVPAFPGTACGDAGSVPALTPPPDPTPGIAAPAAIVDPAVAEGLTGLTPATSRALTYDAVGNQLSAGATTYTYGPSDELLTSNEGLTASYDGAGNLVAATVDGQTTTYGYDAAGRLNEVALPDGRTITYTHDGDGVRVGKSIDGVLATTYTWDKRGELPLLVKETLADDFRRYFHAVGPVAMQTSTGTFYLHGDGLANVTAMTDDDGAVVATYAYDAWGAPSIYQAPDAPDTMLRYGGNLYDADSELYHLRARDYDPTLGRFTQRDPVTPAIGIPVTSRYVYAQNLPTVYGDSSGLYAVPIRNEGYSTEEASGVAAARTGVAAGRFVGTTVLPKAMATKTAFRGAMWVVGGSGGRGALGAAAAIDDTARFAAGASKVLVGVGAALSVALVVLDCMYGTPYQCAGSSISLAFNVGCLAVSGGIGSLACTVAGIGLAYVVTNYGPEIVAGTIDAVAAIGYTRVESSSVSVTGVIGVAVGVTLAVVCVAMTYGLASPLCALAAASLGTYLWTQGELFDAAISAGFNDLGQALSTGFDDALDVLILAGLEIGSVVELLVHEFGRGAAVVVAVLTDVGYEIGDIAADVADLFAMTPALAAQLFTDLGLEIEEVMGAVNAAFADLGDWSLVALTDAMAAAGYAFGEVAGVLADGFDATAQGIAEIGFALNRGIVEIGSALADAADATGEQFLAIVHEIGAPFVATAAALRLAYGYTAEAVVDVFADLGIAVELIADAVNGAFSDVAEWGEQALADALFGAGYAADEIARGLNSAFDASVEAVTGILLGLEFGVNEVADALADVYDATAAELTQVLVDLGVAVDLIAGALSDVYGLAARAIGDLLGDAGAALEDLGDFFGDIGNAVADAFNVTNWF